jgi:hypothetical protein
VSAEASREFKQGGEEEGELSDQLCALLSSNRAAQQTATSPRITSTAGLAMGASPSAKEIHGGDELLTKSDKNDDLLKCFGVIYEIPVSAPNATILTRILNVPSYLAINKYYRTLTFHFSNI